MKFLLLFLIVVLSSCKEAKTDSTKANSSGIADTMKMDPGPPPQKYFGIDEFEGRFINRELLSYLKKKHPNWSMPNQFQWHPQLFAKYKAIAPSWLHKWRL